MHKMKDSGTAWLGEIPEKWDIKRVKHLFKVINGATPKSSDLEYWGGDITWITPADYDTYDMYIESSSRTITTLGLNSCGTTIVPKGSIIISNRAPIGLVAITKKALCTNQGCKALVAKNDIITVFYYYYLSVMSEPLNSLGKGTTFLELSSVDLEEFILPYPTNKVQQQIVNYLDKKCSEIDSLIKTKEITNQKLKDYRQSIIYEAVTKGLDKNTKMKDTGIEWIGEIPEDWHTIKIKYTSVLKGRIGWQGLKADEFIEEGPYLITGTDFEDGLINWKTCVHISDERFNEAPDIHVTEGDLLITKDGTVGKVAIAKNCPIKTSLNSGVLLIKSQKTNKYISKFLLYILLSDIFWKWFMINQNGNSTIIHLYQEQFSNFIFALPSSINEQQKIVDYLDKKCSEIDLVIKTNEKTIEKLKEYRQSVIYEAVTGKVEISNV